MDDLSLFQWLVLGLLSVIALCAGIITLMLGFGLDSNMEMMTRRLEAALGEVRREIENLASDMYQPGHTKEFVEDIERDNEP